MDQFLSFNVKAIVLSTIGVVLGLAAPTTCGAQGPGGGRIRQQETFSGANVLSPGADDDWPLRARDGETVILSVSAPGFDPTVALVGPTGAVVATNDDVRQGRQESLLLVRLDRGGEHQVRVTSANPASGGRYELTVRRFIAAELPIGLRATGTLGKTLARWHRFRAEAGQSLVITARAASFQPLVQVVAPNGEAVEAGVVGAFPHGPSRSVFRAEGAGAYYARIAPSQGNDPLAGYAVTIAPAREIATVFGGPVAARRIDAGGLDLWTFSAEAGDLVRVRVKAVSGEMIGQVSYLPPADAMGQRPLVEGAVPPLVVLPSDPKTAGERIALLNLAGTYQVAVSQPMGNGVDYTFAASRPARPLADDAETVETLRLGGADYWSIAGTAGRLVRVAGTSAQFDVALELYGPQGDLVAADDDGGTGRDARLTAILTERGRHFLRVHAHGDGGSGPYTLRRVSDPARPLALGGRGEGDVGDGGSEVWSFAGRAGQTVILGARSPDFNVKVALYGPDAVEVASDDDGGAGTDSLLSARLPVEGTYTIWVSAAAGGGRYSVQLVEAR